MVLLDRTKIVLGTGFRNFDFPSPRAVADLTLIQSLIEGSKQQFFEASQGSGYPLGSVNMDILSKPRYGTSKPPHHECMQYFEPQLLGNVLMGSTSADYRPMI